MEVDTRKPRTEPQITEDLKMSRWKLYLVAIILAGLGLLLMFSAHR